MQTQALIDRDAAAYHEASVVLAQDERSARRGVASPAGTAAVPVDDRERILGEALIHAADLALAIAAAASEIALLASDVARQCPKAMQPDALTALVLAEAAACSCARLVDINRKLAPDDPRRAAAAEAAQAARDARKRAGCYRRRVTETALPPAERALVAPREKRYRTDRASGDGVCRITLAPRG